MTTVGDSSVSVSATSTHEQQTNEAVAQIVNMLAKRKGAGARRRISVGAGVFCPGGRCEGVHSHAGTNL